MDDVNYVPIPCICSGIVQSKVKENDTLEVSIYNSPIGDFNGPIYAKEIFQSGHNGNINPGDYVKVIITFTFGGIENRFMDVYPNSSHYILGTFNEESVTDITIDNPISEKDSDRIGFTHKESGAGITATEKGDVVLATGGSIYSAGSPFGNGMNENFWKTMAQNHHRVISHNQPYYLSKEHFGMFLGSSLQDKLTKLMPDDHLIIFRRFVTQTKSPDNWVSTCEGSFHPWLGANNNSDIVQKGRETLLSKIINHGNSRVTIEAGEPGTEFINVRVDDVKISEKSLPIGVGATPAVVGNRFKLTISDKGEMDIRALGSGTPTANLNGFHMSINKWGDLTIHAKGNIEISHGDEDGKINSIKMDPIKGIDVTAKNGFRVNGKPLVNKNFLDWISKYKTNLCQATSIGGPAPIHPAALPEFLSGNNTPGKFNTNNIGIIATKIIKDLDLFSTI